ncbi:MAG: adenosine kinase, partial [Gammaproteobacteria bacterium]|nr:adenosine kinase [Gammaproteobacteria bacterium]
MTDPSFDVVGIGNAIVDVLSHTDEAFLARHRLTKGSMTLIDAERATELYACMDSAVECSGGSAANSMVGLASLGGRAAYIGKVRDDVLGEVFRSDIRAAGVEFDTPAGTSGPPTGRCLVLVTPDAQRTMQTLLGASATLGPGDIDEATVAGAAITFLEGYLWDPEPAKMAFIRAAGITHDTGGKVALSLSDPFCVERHRAEFRELVDSHVDVLFANEDELVALYQTDNLDAALVRLRGRCEIAAVTRGAAGSSILSAEGLTEVPAEPVEKVVDTTGAG